jgi:hypothetical protein
LNNGILIRRAASPVEGPTRHELSGPRFVPVVRGVHTAAAIDVDVTLRCRAALLVVPTGSVFSQWTAAALLGGPVMIKQPWIQLIVPPSSQRPRRTDIRGTRHELVAADITRRAGLPVTTPARTFVDLAERSSMPNLVAFGDWALSRGQATLASIDEAIARAGGRRGVIRARAAAGLLDDNVDSPAESLLRIRFLDDGLPRPAVNVDVFDDLGCWIATPDLSYRKAKIAIEYEGAHHLDPDQYRRATQRDQLMAGLGWVVLRATSRDLRPGSSNLTDSIKILLASRPR